MARPRIPLATRFWPRVVVSDNRDDCDLWTGAKVSTGYGSVEYEGRPLLVHRAAWLLATGDLPASTDYEIFHLCDNKLCVNMAHLEIRERGSSERFRRRDGGYGHGKLTPAQVVEIRRKYNTNGFSLRVLGKEYGVSQEAIRDIIRGRTWKELDTVENTSTIPS